MLKIFMFILTLHLALFAKNFNPYPIKTQLLEVDGIYGYIKDDPHINLNSSGVIIQSFTNSKSIIARASVVAKEGGLAKLEFSVFSDLEQNAFPLPNVLPKKADEVVLNFLYDRALIIAPDEKIYDELRSNFEELYFVHVDILAAQLIRSSSLAPKRSDFRKFCANNAVGILIFALENKAKIVDCQNFHKLYEFDISKPDTIELPFYSRIDGYRRNFFDFHSEKIANYYVYYNALIRVNQ